MKYNNVLKRGVEKYNKFRVTHHFLVDLIKLSLLLYFSSHELIAFLVYLYTKHSLHLMYMYLASNRILKPFGIFYSIYLKMIDIYEIIYIVMVGCITFVLFRKEKFVNIFVIYLLIVFCNMSIIVIYSCTRDHNLFRIMDGYGYNDLSYYFSVMIRFIAFYLIFAIYKLIGKKYTYFHHPSNFYK